MEMPARWASSPVPIRRIGGKTPRSRRVSLTLPASKAQRRLSVGHLATILLPTGFILFVAFDIFLSFQDMFGSQGLSPSDFTSIAGPSVTPRIMTRNQRTGTAQPKLSWQGVTCTVIAGTSPGMMSVQQALDSLSHPGTVCIEEGFYNEAVNINKQQSNITFYGRGADWTVISYNSSKDDLNNVWRPATLRVQGANFTVVGITIGNRIVSRRNPAPALVVESARSRWKDVMLVGYHDTVGLKRGTHFFERCTIAGKSDFIFGHGRGYFSNCFLIGRRLPNTTRRQFRSSITAFGTDEAYSSMKPSGAVFRSCRVTGDTMQYLGRPWRPLVVVVWINTYLDSSIMDVGWANYYHQRIAPNGTLAFKQSDFREYGTYGPGYRRYRRNSGVVLSSWTQVPERFAPEVFLGWQP